MIRRPVATLVVLAVVVAVLGAGVDLAVRQAADSQLAARARSASGAASAEAAVGTFPLLYHVAAQGTVPRVDLRLDRVPVGPVTIHRLDVHLRRVAIDRNQLFGHRRVRVTGIDSGSATATLTAADLSAASGRTIVVPGDGTVDVVVAGQRIPAAADIAGGRTLELRYRGVRLVSVDLGRNRFLRDCALTLAFPPGAVEAGCTMTPVPPDVIAAIDGAA